MSILDYFKNKRPIEIDTEISVHEKWCNVVHKAIKDYQSLSTTERVWYNTKSVIEATNNGGLISYYYNSGTENIYDAMNDIELLGQERIVELIKEFNKIIFHKVKVPTDIHERNKYIDNLSENADNKLQVLESEIAILIPDLENQLNLFIHEKRVID